MHVPIKDAVRSYLAFQAKQTKPSKEEQLAAFQKGAMYIQCNVKMSDASDMYQSAPADVLLKNPLELGLMFQGMIYLLVWICFILFLVKWNNLSQMLLYSALHNVILQA